MRTWLNLLALAALVPACAPKLDEAPATGEALTADPGARNVSDPQNPRTGAPGGAPGAGGPIAGYPGATGPAVSLAPIRPALSLRTLNLCEQQLYDAVGS